MTRSRRTTVSVVSSIVVSLRFLEKTSVVSCRKISASSVVSSSSPVTSTMIVVGEMSICSVVKWSPEPKHNSLFSSFFATTNISTDSPFVRGIGNPVEY